MRLRVRWTRLIAVLFLIVMQLPRSQATAAATVDPNAQAIAANLQNFTALLGTLGGYDKLGKKLPLTTFDPGGDAGLRITKLFSDSTPGADSVASRLAAAIPSLGGLPDVAAALQGLSGAYGGVNLAVSGPGPGDGDTPVVQTNSHNGKLVDIQLELHATRAVSIPVDFARGPVSLHGGAIGANLALDTVLHFQYDTSAPGAATSPAAFYLIANSSEQPAVTATVTANADVPRFAAQLGFADVGVDGHAAFNVAVKLPFQDPGDGDGKITRDEWSNTPLAQLLPAQYVDGAAAGLGTGDAVSATLTLRVPTSLIPTPLSASVSLDIPSLAHGAAVSPTVSLGGLDGLANTSPETMLGGFAGLASSLLAAQGGHGFQLPFTNNNLSDASDLGKRLMTLLTRQADAYVRCGNEVTDAGEITGTIKGLRAGDDVYCEAATTGPTTAVTWTVGGNASFAGVLDANNTLTQTVALSPTAAAHFKMTADGAPTVSVDFALSDGTEHTAVPRIQTAADLRHAIEDGLGLSRDTVPVRYDPTSSALTYGLSFDDNPGQYTAGALDIGSQISDTIGLVGLTPGSGARLYITPGIHVNPGFGAILETSTPISPTDRFFVQTGAGGQVLTATAPATATLDFKGRIGFLGVSATGAPAAGGDAFSIGPADPTRPMLAVAFNTPAAGVPVTTTDANGVQTVNAIPNAIRIPDLLRDIGHTITATCNVSAAAGLRVSASLGQGASATEIGHGGVAVSWPNVFGAPGAGCTPDPRGLQVTPDAGFTDKLSGFNFDPNDPNKLLGLILDNLDTIANGLQSFPGLDRKLPVVNARLSDLVRQAATLKQKIDLLRTGTTAPDVIHCDTSGGITGDAATAANLAPGDIVKCSATIPSPGDPAVSVQSPVIWTATGAVPVTAADGVGPDNAANSATVAFSGTAPTAAAQFRVTDPGGAFKLSLQYALGATGPVTPASADYPAAQVPGSLQDLNGALTKLLGLPASALQIGLAHVNGDSGLVIRLKYGVCSPTDAASDLAVDCASAVRVRHKLATTFSFDAGSTSFVGLQGSAGVNLEYGAMAQLNLGIDLAHPTQSGILNSTSLSVGAYADITPTPAITANIGPLQVASSGGMAQIGATLSVSDPAYTGDASSEAPIVGTPTTAFQPALTGTNVDCDLANGSFSTKTQGGCARLPVSLDGTALGDVGFTFHLPDATTAYTIPPNLSDSLANALLNFDTLFDGLNYGLNLLKGGLKGSSYNAHVPLVGDNLSAGADTIQQFQDHVVTPLKNFGDKVKPLTKAQDDAACLHDLLYTALGPSAGGDVQCGGGAVDLGQIGGAGLLSDPGAIRVTAVCAGGPCAAGDSATSLQDLSVTLNISHSATASTPFDLGFPGLRLSSDTSQVSATGAVSLAVTFGLSRTAGFYLDNPAGASLVHVDGHVDLLTHLTADLAFLQADITNTQTTRPALALGADLRLSGPLTMGSLSQSGTPSALRASIHADVNVGLHLRTGLRGDETAGFPSVEADFVTTWSRCFGTSGACAGADATSDPYIAFNNVALDAGTFVSKFLVPTAKQIQSFTKPFQPIIDTLQAPMPGVSQLSELTGGPPITMEDLLAASCGCDLTFVNRIIMLVKFVNGIDTSGAANLLIPIGSFTVSGANAQKAAPTPDQSQDPGGSGSLISAENVDAGGFQHSLARALGGSVRGPSGSDLTSQSARDSSGLTFPFLQHPSEIFGLLMGKDISLVQYDTGYLRATASLHYNFPPIFVGPIPVGIGIFGDFTLQARFIVGYDTSGLRRVLAGGSGEHLLDGVYLLTQSDGRTIPQVELIGEVGASAAVDLVIVSAGIKGGIRLTVALSLHDPDGDGKVRIDEIASQLHNPICLFDITGKLSAFLDAFVSIDLFFYSKEFDFPIIDITLLDFSTRPAACDNPPPPHLANPNETNADPENPSFNPAGYLVLNVGPYAADRNLATDVTNEKLTVRQIRRSFAQNGTTVTRDGFSVDGFGISQDYFCDTNCDAQGRFKGVYADGGSGADDLTFASGTDSDLSTPLSFTAPLVAIGGDGNDTIRGGDGPNTISGDRADGSCQDSGGACNDTLSGGAGSNTISGGPGDDTISGGPGDNHLYGNDGNDVIHGGAGNNVTDGGAGDDTLYGGAGTNALIGGPGNDTLTGGSGPNVMVGDGDTDAATAQGWLGQAGSGYNLPAIDAACAAADAPGGGADVLVGGTNNDLLIGGAGNDLLTGGAGNDRLCGNSGDDVLNGDNPNDPAATSDDNLSGGAGNDILVGGPGANALTGGAGNDILVGGRGSVDIPRAQAALAATTGNDAAIVALVGVANAGDGNNVLYGDDPGDPTATGADYLFGGSGNDILGGGPANDYPSGGAGNDILLGDGGTVSNVATARTWLASTPGGNDPAVLALVSNAESSRDGADTLIDGDGADFLFGEGGADTMYGDNTDGSCATTAAAPSCADYMDAGTGDDTVRGGPGDDYMLGASGNDALYGDAGADTLYGDNRDGSCSTAPACADVMHGGSGNDYMEGGAGSDRMFGEAGDDSMIGGNSSAGKPDAGNTMAGGSGADVMVGANGAITATGATNPNDPADPSPARVVQLYDAPQAPACVPASSPTLYGDNTMDGGTGDDMMYGGAGADTMLGGPGNDVMYGGPGADTLYGDSGQNDLVGGTGRTLGSDPSTARDGVCDGADTVYGGDGSLAGRPDSYGLSSPSHSPSDANVIAGDNADIQRPTDGGGYWLTNTPDGSIKRTVRLLDMATTSYTLRAGTSAGDALWGDYGNDVMYGGGGPDTMSGGPGDDYMEGNAGADIMDGGTGNDDMIGGTSAPAMIDAGAGAGNILTGGDGADVMCGNNCAITRTLTAMGAWLTNAYGGSPARVTTLFDAAQAPNCPTATPATAGDDYMDGGAGNDTLYGQDGADSMHGGAGDDHMEGGNGADTMWGDAGQDDLIGGTGRTVSNDPSTARDGYCDGADTVYGGDGSTAGASGSPDGYALSNGGDGAATGAGDHDMIVGDNATIDRPLDGAGLWQYHTYDTASGVGALAVRAIHLYDVATTSYAPAAGASGADTLWGETGDDTMYGQGGADTMSGGAGDDYMEGNAGTDTMYGNDGNDDMVGGTGLLAGDPISGTNGRLDGNDELHGGAGYDVMAGDNAVIKRTLDASGAWQQNTYDGGVRHDRIRLLDVATTAYTPGAGTSGDDTMYGDAGNDTMYGQGGNDTMYGQGGNDTMRGGDGSDYMEGNAGADVIFGDAGQDDLVGGTGPINDDPATGANGRLDGADYLFGESDSSEGAADGGASADVMAGDNAVITRALTAGGQWQTNTFNGAYTRNVALLDQQIHGQPVVDPRTYGNDTMYGNSADDTMYGQGGDDTMFGGRGNDYMEGNSGADTMLGGGDQDDMIGGSSLPGRLDKGNAMYGDSNPDGSTAPTDSHDAMIGNNGVITRPLTAGGAWVTLTYTDTAGQTTRYGRAVRMLDSAPGDTAGSDRMYGNGGDDDMVGGFDDGSAGHAPALASVPNCDNAGTLTNVAGDLMCGGTGDDAMLGDQGVITDTVEDGSRARSISIPAPFLQENILPKGQLTRQVALAQPATGGADVLEGGAVAALQHVGAGNDLMNGNAGNDRVFGDDGSDVVWGGTNITNTVTGTRYDHLYGGYGDDFLDVTAAGVVSTTGVVTQSNGANLSVVAPISDSLQGIDYIYGGWGRDAMQADQGGPGPQPGDRLIDWVGNYNLYYTCPGAYGEGVITRQHSPAMQQYLIDQATGDGATGVATQGTSGFDELGLVYTGDTNSNNGSPYPGSPGHFTCAA